MSLIESINSFLGVEPDNPLVRATVAVVVGSVGVIMILLVILYYLNLQGSDILAGSNNLAADAENIRNISIFLLIVFIFMTASLVYYVILPWRKTG